jgi:hypothetical protein
VRSTLIASQRALSWHLQSSLNKWAMSGEGVACSSVNDVCRD